MMLHAKPQSEVHTTVVTVAVMSQPHARIERAGQRILGHARAVIALAGHNVIRLRAHIDFSARVVIQRIVEQLAKRAKDGAALTARARSDVQYKRID